MSKKKNKDEKYSIHIGIRGYGKWVWITNKQAKKVLKKIKLNKL